MIQQADAELPIVSEEGKRPRLWMVADGAAEFLVTNEFDGVFEQARLEFENHGIILKKFPHDRSLPDTH